MANNLIVTDAGNVVQEIVDFIRASPGKRVCLTSMSHSYDFMVKQLEQAGVDRAKVSFIDCITKSLFLVLKDTPDCAYIHIQIGIKDFSYELTSKLQAFKGCDAFIFDSLSDLKQYWPQSPDTMMSFVKSLFPAFSQFGADSYFILHCKDKGMCNDALKGAFDGVFSSMKLDKQFMG